MSFEESVFHCRGFIPNDGEWDGRDYLVFQQDEWTESPPLTDVELDDVIVRLVRAYPGRLGRARIAHIIAGHPGRKIKAKYSHLSDYGRDPFVSLDEVRHRVRQLLQTGRLEQRGDNPPRLVPAGDSRRKRKPRTRT